MKIGRTVFTEQIRQIVRPKKLEIMQVKLITIGIGQRNHGAYSGDATQNAQPLVVALQQRADPVRTEHQKSREITAVQVDPQQRQHAERDRQSSCLAAALEATQ